MWYWANKKPLILRSFMLRKTIMKKSINKFGLFVLAAIAVPAALAQKPIIDVPYVPTPNEVVEEMLKVAHVGKDDVVYDLGCGDGRIVITAAQKYGARGVGIDISEERIKESNENARKAGVTDRVKFLRQDLFETDLSEATVVT